MERDTRSPRPVDVSPLPLAASRAMKLLIVRLSSMGDVIHALPLAANAHAAGATVGWLVERPFLRLKDRLRILPLFHGAQTLDRVSQGVDPVHDWHELAALDEPGHSEQFSLVLPGRERAQPL